jgi:phosphatidate cytidylyltransferase
VAARARARRAGRGTELLARVVVAVPAIAVAVALLSFGPEVFAAGAFVAGVLCLHELFRLYERVRPAKLAGFAAVAGLAAAALWGGERQVLLALMASVPLTFLLASAMPRGRSSVTAGMALTLLGIVWVGLPVAIAILLFQLPHGSAIIVNVLVGTFVGDTGAYLGGRAFGRRPLAPAISPSKTVEGLLIGMVAAVVGTMCAGLYQDWLSHGEAALLGAAVAVAAPLGDLFESRVKRDAGVKDSGGLFGPHGGALDRLDAALFALVAGYWVWLAILG